MTKLFAAILLLAWSGSPMTGLAPARAATAAARREVLPFIHDDYPKALAEARARKLPLFIDNWAPW